DIGIIIELKYAEGGNMDAACADALAQIENRRYIEDFKRDEMGKIIKYGIAFYRNKCKVAVGE
ncbi:MAG: PD-(D/E)XK nuclease domain-containing protein, partial [Clostridiales bacterium]|nr:PD-(D/E)XK nuclease domain-containing protein [Clostridiales bacterium]